ncbi:prolyl oligopeptidase family serine peptidase [Deinococcus pimensis]|uniref:prolyl oligopeptidase family serine peptidase n=1 Tax=Deinococcus pimensis TaxID=309888 RepID=UPI0004BB4B66|nr:prolyl oligopeptidase family serine peptidase [Deinococcus pimensis]
MLKPAPPVARRGDHVDVYHGTTVPDPYRWLEDPDSPETRAWVEAQNTATAAFLTDVPARGALRERLRTLWDHPRAGAPWRRGARLFRLRNTGLQDQNVLYVRDDEDGGAGDWRVLLDPNTLSEDGTVALQTVSVSRDGRFLAYSVSAGGSDWQTWRVRDVESGADLPEELSWSKFSGAEWLPDGSGFLYGRYPQPGEGEALTAANYGQQLWLHRVGTPQTRDELVYERPDRPTWGFSPVVTHDGRWLVLHVWEGTDPRNLVYVRPLSEGGSFTELVPSFEASYTLVHGEGSALSFRTNRDAPLGKLVGVDLADLAAGWRDVVPEGEHLLEAARPVPGGFLTLLGVHASHRLSLVDRSGAALGEVTLPTLGTVSAVNALPDDPEVFVEFTSFLTPVSAYRLDVSADAPALAPLDPPALDFDTSAYETRQVFATSRDGTRVPMFLVHRAGLTPTGDHPTLLYGYGGFDISLTPSFSAARLPWLELGGVLAVANLRGGGEYGEAWHAAGTVHRKQNVFDDFVACAEHLVAMGLTRPSRLAIQGGSNGGLLVGACMTQRPDLFGACLPDVGVMDMLRFHRFTIGWAWVSDYGSSDDPEQFRTLLAYSPLHNLREGVCYPATLVTTGDHDDRVVPAHSFKFAAALQHAQACDRPVLIRVQTRAGHGQGKPTRLLIEEAADVLAFLTRALDMDV